MLIPRQQFLPRTCQVLVGIQDRDQGTNREAPLDDEIATDGEKEERRQLVDEVIEKLDEKLATIDFVPDVVNCAQAVCKPGQFEKR